MRALLAAAIFAFGFFLIGCQAAGPGVEVDIRAEPKKGYTPPEDDSGYGGGSDTTPHDHTFHRIDYHRLPGVAVWVESDPPTATASSGAPIDASVDLHSGSASAPEDFTLASVGGQLTITAAPGSKYVLHTSKGDFTDVPSGAPITLTEPGLVEVISDTRDEPQAFVYVAPTSWAKKARGGERVTFAPLPPGNYRVTTWHPILPGMTQTVQVSADQLSKVTLTVSVNSLPKPK